MDIQSHEGGEIPMTISSAYIADHRSSSVDDHRHHSSNIPPDLSALTAEGGHHHHQNTAPYATKKGELVVKYEECLKNHAASIGGNATDGCGEFMPSGEEGTLEALKCSACGCHRNFHRKEIEGGPSSCDCFHYPFRTRKMIMTEQRGLVPSGADALGYGINSLIPRVIMPLGAMQTSGSEEMEGMVGGVAARPPAAARKRFRTKFTPEQKEKMLDFAEKVGWRLQREEESQVQHLCQEIGVKRRVLRVWMHNNKNNLAKKNSTLPLA